MGSDDAGGALEIPPFVFSFTPGGSNRKTWDRIKSMAEADIDTALNAAAIMPTINVPDAEGKRILMALLHDRLSISHWARPSVFADTTLWPGYMITALCNLLRITPAHPRNSLHEEEEVMSKLEEYDYVPAVEESPALQALLSKIKLDRYYALLMRCQKSLPDVFPSEQPVTTVAFTLPNTLNAWLADIGEEPAYLIQPDGNEKRAIAALLNLRTLALQAPARKKAKESGGDSGGDSGGTSSSAMHHTYTSIMPSKSTI